MGKGGRRGVRKKGGWGERGTERSKERVKKWRENERGGGRIQRERGE